MESQETVERRIVTVLFADLVGFTTLSETFDPEDVAIIQDRYFATVRETIGLYGGRLEKFIGDAAMAVFGIPRSRDDDAARAVRSGLALILGVQQIAAELGLDDNALQLRVGINTGEAVLAASGEDAGRVTGDTVNTAARFQSAAPVGGVLIGETTALAVADVADLGPVQSLELKGKAELTQARVVTGVRAEPSREQAMGDLRAPMLGRDDELATLLDAQRRTAAGTTERWLIVAPPGVGKSRLLRELADQIDASDPAAVVWRSRARPDTVAPFDPIARLLLDALKSTDPTQAKGRLTQAVAAAGATDERAQVVAEACLSVVWPPSSSGESAGESGAPQSEREALFAAWLEGLDALAGSAAQVWLIEDVHWAGGDVLAFVDYAAARTPTAGEQGRMIVVTARPSLLEANSDWASEDSDNVSSGRRTLQLGPLQPTDARALVSALVGDALPDELVERIAERSDGNCLFIEELLRTWVSVGTLTPDERGGWRLGVSPEEIPLPTSVQQIYAAQLDDLPDEARRLARRASVAGRRFPVGALEPLGVEAEAGLEPLKRRELVIGPVAEPLWGEAFSYRHALLRDAGYASLARAERARLHVRLARWLEQAAGDRSTEIAEVIAGHYSAALESAPSLAQEVDDGLNRAAVSSLAAEWYERAGQGTLSLSAHDAARQLFQRSIDLTPDESRYEKGRRWERLGDATAFAADMDKGAAAYEKSIDFYRQAIDVGSRGFDAGSKAMTKAADKMAERYAWLESISPEGAQGLAEGAAALRQGSTELQQSKVEFQQGLLAAQSGLARASASLADVWYQQLRFAEARDLANATMAELPDADSVSTAKLLVARAKGTIGASGYTPELQADIERAVELSHGANDTRTELKAKFALTSAMSEVGLDEMSTWQDVAETARQVGDWSTAVSAAINGASWWLDDRAADAIPAIESAREIAFAHGLTEQVGWTNYMETEARFSLGDWDRALEVGEQALDLADANAYLRLNVRTLHVVVPMAAVRGIHSVLERTARFYASIEGRFEFPDSPYARVVRAAQDVELAAAGLIPPYVPDVESRLDSFAEEPSGPSYVASLDRLMRAWIEAGQVDGAERAASAMTHALVRFPQASSLSRGTHELLHTRVALARRDHDVAASRGNAALELFRTVSAPWWIAKAIRLLERAGAADDQLVAEAAVIEGHLGSREPTK